MKSFDESQLKNILSALDQKKAIDIRVLDLRKIVTYTDFLIICSGSSTTHVNALVMALRDSLSEGGRPIYVNKSRDDSWWILDFVDIVVHVFQSEARRYYDLEGLWGDAERLQI